MPMMQGSVSVAANSVSVNQLAGKLYEFIQPGTRVTFSGAGSAAGLNANLICGIPVVNDEALNTANRFPLIPDDIIVSENMVGNRLVLTFRNTTAGALTAFWRIDL